jgi:hypothetical protein
MLLHLVGALHSPYDFEVLLAWRLVIDMFSKWWHCTLPFFCFLPIKRVVPCSSSCFPITCLLLDISHAMHMNKDLRNHGENNVLVKKTRATIDPDVLKNYNTVEVMHPYIERCCNVYAQDLTDCLFLNDKHLPVVLATPSLLNSLFGNKKRLVGSGLMSKG